MQRFLWAPYMCEHYLNPGWEYGTPYGEIIIEWEYIARFLLKEVQL